MSLKQSSPRANRFKKNGKGGFVLAVFLVAICLLMIGGYWLHHYQQKHTAKVQKPTPIPQQAVPQPVHSSATAITPPPVAAVKPVEQPKQALSDYYTGDVHPNQLVPPSAHRPPAGKAELAIIVDDMGSSLAEARTIAGIGLPISFAIIPGLKQDRAVAAFAADQGIEILVHMPMQPKEYPQRRLEANGLLLEQSDEELRIRMFGYLQILPQAVGANNHMGSGFTEHSDKMRIVLKVLKEKGLFYVDSITTPKTTGLKVAAELKVSSGRRDVFLDNEQNEGYIRGQLDQAVARARKNGRAIAICHPHPTTIATLAKSLPELQSKGVKLVKITRLVVTQ